METINRYTDILKNIPIGTILEITERICVSEIGYWSWEDRTIKGKIVDKPNISTIGLRTNDNQLIYIVNKNINKMRVL